MIAKDDSMPDLTDDEKENVIRIGWAISQCKCEPDKLFIYNDMLYKLYKAAYRRNHNI